MCILRVNREKISKTPKTSKARGATVQLHGCYMLCLKTKIKQHYKIEQTQNYSKCCKSPCWKSTPRSDNTNTAPGFRSGTPQQARLPLTRAPSKQQHYGSSSSSSCCSKPCSWGPSLTVTPLPPPSWCLARGFLHQLVKIYFSLPATFQFFPNCHFYSGLNPPLSKGSFPQPHIPL